MIKQRFFARRIWGLMVVGWALAIASAPGLAQVAEQRQALRPETMLPAGGAQSVCPDTTLRLTFSVPVRLGRAGSIRVIDVATQAPVETIDLSVAAPAPPAGRGNAATRPSVSVLPPERAAAPRLKTIGGLTNCRYYPVIATDRQVEIFLAPDSLSYGKQYEVSIDAGCFESGDGAASAEVPALTWRFSIRPAAPAAGSARLTVAADSSGDFATLQGALDFIPAGNRTPTTILLRSGTYTGMVYVADKHAIRIVGEDRKQSIVEFATNDAFNSGIAPGAQARAPGGYRRGVFRAVNCQELTLSNLTIRNTTPRGGTQAEAIILNGSPEARAILKGVDLYSFQDTLQINGQAYIADSYIEGDVDFMWGTGPCFFENCTARSVRSNAYYTQIRNTAANHGYVFYHCTFDGAEGVTGNVLSRIDPGRFPNSEVVLIDCVMTDAVSPAAWRFDQGGDAANVRFWEYNSKSPDGRPVDVSQRLTGSRQLTQPQDASIIAQYSDPKFVLGHDWNPRAAVAPPARD